MFSFTIYDSTENAIAQRQLTPSRLRRVMRIHNPLLERHASLIFTLSNQLIGGSVILDRVDIPFESEAIEIKSSGFYLNGKGLGLRAFPLSDRTGNCHFHEQIGRDTTVKGAGGKHFDSTASAR